MELDFDSIQLKIILHYPLILVHSISHEKTDIWTVKEKKGTVPLPANDWIQ